MTKNFELGQAVKFIRVSPDGDVVRGEGMVVGKIISLNNRINYQVRENGPNVGSKAWSLEPFAIECSEEDEKKYLEHVKAIRAIADDYNKRSQDMIVAGNKAIDDLNTEFFGPQVI
jgi:hypothetical protein